MRTPRGEAKENVRVSLWRLKEGFEDQLAKKAFEVSEDYFVERHARIFEGQPYALWTGKAIAAAIRESAKADKDAGYWRE